jgi:hypothetical protein
MARTARSTRRRGTGDLRRGPAIASRETSGSDRSRPDSGFAGQLVDRRTRQPLAGYQVHGVDRSARAPIDLGYDLTDQDGRFTLLRPMLGDGPTGAAGGRGQTSRLSLHFVEPGGRPIARMTVSAPKGGAEAVRIAVAVPRPAAASPPTIDQLASGAKLTLPASLRRALRASGIRTVTDVLTKGLAGRLDGARSTAVRRAAGRLQAQANLRLLSSAPATNARLIARGYPSIDAIARAPRSHFVTAVGDRLGETAAGRVWTEAVTQTRSLNNVLALARTGIVNGFASPRFDPRILELFPATCGCKDCEAAVSPLAYLADLLDYAVTHLVHRGRGPVDLQYLTNTLHQPFGALPATCDAVEDKVRQVLLCVEVLRSYLGRRPLANRVAEAALRQAEQQHRQDAYVSLLRAVGTSFDEIRLVRQLDPASDDQRVRLEQLHDRLAVDFDALRPRALLDALHFDPSLPAGHPRALTEARLEELFGLRDTTRNPLDPAANARVPQLEEWRLRHLRTVWRAQDWPDAGPGEGRPLIDPDVIGPDDLRRPVPKARRQDPDGPFDLWLERRRLVDTWLTTYRRDREAAGLDAILRDTFGDPLPDLDGLLAHLAQGSDPTRVDERIQQLGLTVESFTRLMAIREKDRLAGRDPRSPAVDETEWQEVYSILAQVRKVGLYPRWRREEAPIEFGARNFWISLREPRDRHWPPPPLLRQPFVDPERLTRAMLDEAGPRGGSARLWHARRERLDHVRHELRVERETSGHDAMLRAALGHPDPGDALQHDVATIERELNDGRTAVVQRARRKIGDLHLTVDAFTWLAAVGARAADVDPLNHPTAAEWGQVYGVLTTARKLKHEYPAWIREEARLPLIDPDVLTLDDLPEPTIGAAAIDLWRQRRTAVDRIRRELDAARAAGGFDAVLRAALGHPRPGDPVQHDIARLVADQRDPDRATAARARRRITRDLHLTLESFALLAAVRAKDADPDPFEKPTRTEWDQIEAILTEARKAKHLFPAWVREERRLGVDVEYWRALKAPLARWRAPGEARRRWQRALDLRGGRPLIDPDLVGPGDLREPVAGDPAYDIWKRRHDWLHDPRTGRLAHLRTARQGHGQPLAGLDSILEDTLGVPAADLLALEQLRAHGTDIRSRLAQLGLTTEAYAALLRARRLVEGGERLLASEWDEVYAILAAVLKQRQHTAWGEEEQAAGIVLGPDLFQIPPETPTPPPSAAGSSARWLANAAARREWQQTLRTRLDQERSVRQALEQAVDAAEQAVLPALRNALIMAARAPGASLDARARWVTDHLLIDAGADACQTTTRIGQAIETLQGLLWSVRTGQLQDTVPQLELDAEEFDEEWRWIGSYPSWRAAMFVFLYPENVLVPTLRTRQTPAFRKLAADLRTSSRVTPDLACRAARAYEDYYRDVCHLLVEASCRARTRVHAGECRDRTEAGHRELFYAFARGEQTNTLYWSTFDPEDDTEHAQRFWEPVGGFANAVSLLGAVPYDRDADQRFIFLFAIVEDDGQEKLAFLKYHLEQQGWDAEPTFLEELPDDATVFTAVVKQHQRAGQPPHLAVRLPSGAIYDRHLNREGSDWADEDWHMLVDAARGAGLTVLHAMVESGERRFCLFATDLTGRVKYAEYRSPSLGATSRRPAVLRMRQYESRMDVFLRGEDDALWHTWRADGEPWTDWQSLGGPLASDPAAVSDGYFSVHVFALGAGGALLHRHLAGRAWANWESLGGTWTSPPAAASWGPDRLDVFVRGADDGLHHHWRDAASARWQQRRLPDPPGGAGVLAPAAVSRNARLIDLFVVTAGGAVQHLSHDEARGGWAQAWTQVHQGPWGSSPAIASFHPLQLALFLRAGDLSLWHRNWTQTAGWQPGQSWEALLTSAPAATGRRQANVSGSQDRYVLEVLAMRPDGNVWLGRHEQVGNTSTGAANWSGLDESLGADVGQGQGLVWRELGSGTWLGAFQWAGTDNVYAFWRDGASATRYAAVRPDQAVAGPWTGSPQLDAIAAHAGGSVHADQMLLAYKARDPLFPYRYRGTFRRNGWRLAETQTVHVAPLIPTPFSTLFTLTERMTADDLQLRRRQLGVLYRAVGAATWPRAIQAYVEEAHYFVPVHLAMQLQRQGHYVPALDWFRTVYDYSVPVAQRKIHHGLTREETLGGGYQRPDDWLLDPLNPHGIAATRTNTYTRFTLISLVRCFLEYADTEFTRDTAESVPRARTLYRTALELLDAEAVKPSRICEDRIGTLEIELHSAMAAAAPAWLPALRHAQQDLRKIGDPARLESVIQQIRRAVGRNGSWDTRVATIRALVRREAAPQAAPTVAGVLDEHRHTLARAHTVLLADRDIAEAVSRAGSLAGHDFARSVGRPAGAGNPAGVAPGAAGGAVPRELAVNPNRRVRNPFLPGVTYRFCIPPNPLLEGLRLHAELNLFKIRTCRNIAGIERTLDAYAAPTDARSGLPTIGAGGQLVLPGVVTLQPTPYRYSALIDRAKHAVHLAAQIEASLLAALEKRDAEYYGLLRARQDVQLARAEIVLQDLRVKEAEGGVELARLQQQRARIEADHYEALIEENLTTLEQLAIGFMVASGALQLAASVFYSLAAAQQLAAYPGNIDFSPAGGLSSTAASVSALAGVASTTASIISTYASYERRKQEWEFQKSLAEHDFLIGGQQVDLAQARVRVVGQERRIADIRQDHAKDTADFLANKFTNVELYDWMSDVLEGVYSSFLQQATATARLAENQLAFERQETPPSFIQADYWEAPGGTDLTTGLDGTGPDRRGLTGSARLLRDLHQLDQYAFETDQRKLQLSRTLSLAHLAPTEFQRFRETGVMTFGTPMQLFDRDFPGHYLRLIKQVRVSVLALIPPPQGIHATLSTTGTARTVLGAPLFQTVRTNYGPQSVALSSPRDATGLFELRQPPDMRAPFEGLGIDTTWELHMPKPSNLFDYGTIADVLVTIDYTALSSPEYRQQVIADLDRTFSADRPFSFRQHFADGWYDLHNPDRTATPMQVRYRTRRADFPPGIEELRIQHVVLYFVPATGRSFEAPPVQLRFGAEGGGAMVGGDATPVDRVVSTRRGNAGSWTSMIGSPPVGEWELTLPDLPEVRTRFQAGDIDDILFVITYAGLTPPWPA